METLAREFGMGALLAVHDGKAELAWTNLLVATRLATAWEPGLTDTALNERFECTLDAFEATWQILQWEGWTDIQLAGLQHEWETPDFLRQFPELVAFTRVIFVNMREQERRRPAGIGSVLAQMMGSPRSAVTLFHGYLGERRYTESGSLWDERALMLYYSERELEVRHAIGSPTWREMRELPGVTRVTPFRAPFIASAILATNSNEPSSARSLQMSLIVFRDLPELVARAAETEARRRLVITAIAVERFRVRHGAYPKTLA
jgi:hypothetical protein